MAITEAQVRDADGVIVQVGTGLGARPGHTVYPVDPTAIEAALAQPHDALTRNPDGTVSVVYDQAAADAAASAKAARETERTTATTELGQQYQDALTRLNQIIDFQGTPTAAQVYDAVQDLALYLRKTLRYLESQRGG